MNIQTTEHFDKPFFSKLENIIISTLSFSDVATFIYEHTKELGLSATDLKPLVQYSPYLIVLFQPIKENKDSVAAFRMLLTEAINNQFDPSTEPSQAVKQVRRSNVIDSYLEDYSYLFCPSVYQDTKDALVFSQCSVSQGKVNLYLPYMYAHMSKCDFAELFRYWQTNFEPASWQYSNHVCYALENDMVHLEYKDWALRQLTFARLNDCTRSKFASEALALSPWNYKHLSDSDRNKYANEIDLSECPMLIAFHPKRTSQSSDEWKSLLEIEPRALRYVPKSILESRELFSDDYLYSLLLRNQTSSNLAYDFNRGRYKLMSFINGVAPDRLSVLFCEKVKAGGLAERNHQVLINKLKRNTQ